MRSTWVSHESMILDATEEPVSSRCCRDEIEDLGVVVVVERLELDHLPVDPAGEIDRRCHQTYAIPPDMPAREVSTGRTQDDDTAAGHVLAPVVADAFDDGRGPGVANAEALADPATEERTRRWWRRRAGRCRR